VRLELRGLQGRVRAKYYLLDAKHDMKLVREEVFAAGECAAYMNMDNLSTVLVELEAL